MRVSMLKLGWLVMGLCSLVAEHAFSDAKEYFFQKKTRENLTHKAPSSVESRWYPQSLQHDVTSEDVFQQRYFYDGSLATNSASPIFLYLCGEWTCSDRDLSGAIRTYAGEVHAHLIALEHRYYGESQPFGELSAENLRFLSTDLALKDAKKFIDYVRNEMNLSGDIVVFGGSYPGSLAAYFRAIYPELSVGALASSAPVLAKESFEEYDAHVTSVVSAECASQIRKVVREIELSINEPEAVAILKEKFDAQDIKNPINFVYAVADTGAFAVQYGYHENFCDRLTSAENAIDGYASFARFMGTQFGYRLKDLSFESAESLNPDDYLDGFAMRQWLYQSCTEYGYWQVAHSDAEKSTRSRLINLEFHRNVCKTQFGLEEAAQIESTNQKFYRAIFSQKLNHLVLSNGANDPWSQLSILPDNRGELAEGVLTWKIDDAAHCDDLRSPKSSESEAMKKIRKDFRAQLKLWLKL